MTIYLEYDHSQSPGDRINEYVGPFDSTDEAASFRSINFAPSAPIQVVSLEAAPIYAIFPEQLIAYQHRND